MDKLHQDILTSRLEDALLNGCSHITWNELYKWYGVTKLAARTYRDIVTRWQDLTDDPNAQVMWVEGRGGMYIFSEAAIRKMV